MRRDDARQTDQFEIGDGRCVLTRSNDPRGFALVVNATPLGVSPSDLAPLDITGLTPAIFVGDVIIKPEVTPLLQHARQLGCKTQTGVEMFENSVGLMADFFAHSIGGGPPTTSR